MKRRAIASGPQRGPGGGAGRRNSRHLALSLSVLPLAVAGCGGDDAQPDSAPEAAAVELDCERDGYPCSLAEVDPAILRASDSLATEVADRLSRGESLEAAAEVLSSRPDIVELLTEEVVMVFRLEGGRPTWVVSPAAFEEGARGGGGASRLALERPGSPDEPPSRVGTAAMASTRPASSPSRIVGADRQNRRDKRALVLSPFAWEFEPDDEGNEVAAFLADTRGYENRVDFYSNPTDPTDANIRWGHWTGWDAYDVVHVSTHGWQACLSLPGRTGCHSAILTAIQLPSFNIPMGTTPAGTSAVYWTHKYGGGHYRTYSLTQDFFRFQYPGGLEDTIVFFSACQTTMAPAIVQALSGAATAIIGWDQVVLSSDAQPAALELYRRLGNLAETTAEAYSAVVKAGLSTSTTAKHGLATLTHHASADLRIRETIWLRDPAGGAEVLDGSALMIDGAIGDGIDDRLPITFQVDGIQPGRVQEYVPHLSVNGVEVRETFDLTKGRQVDQDTWIVTDTASLWFDVFKGYRANLDVWLDLPEGGDTRVEALDVELVGSGITYSGYRNGRFHDSLEASLQLLPNITTNVDPSITCVATFSFTDDEGRYLLITAGLGAPLSERVYPISGWVSVNAVSPEGTPYTMLEQPPNTFGLEGTNPPGPEWVFRARGTSGSLEVESITPAGVGVSFVADAEFDGNIITYRGKAVAPLDGLSNFADMGDSCLDMGP